MTGSGDRPMDVRRAGVLLHVTSLPDGDLGPDAHRFVDFLADAGCTVWQVLPLVPTQVEGSPYNAVSAMAGNPALVSAELAAQAGLDDPRDLTEPQRAAFTAWCAEHADWLRAVRRVRRAARGARADAVDDLGAGPARPRPRQRWPRRSRRTTPGWPSCASSSGSSPASGPTCARYAAERGVLFFGDLPIFVSHDSADVWASRDLFELDGQGRAGHGDRSAAGLLRGRRAALEQPALRLGRRWPHDGFALVAAPDRTPARAVRPGADRPLPRLRGGVARAGGRAETAKDGYWVTSPGREVLAALLEAAGPGTLVAEDLGRDHAGGGRAAATRSGCPG